jgi:hypothetical protein
MDFSPLHLNHYTTSHCIKDYHIGIWRLKSLSESRDKWRHWNREKEDAAGIVTLPK